MSHESMKRALDGHLTMIRSFLAHHSSSFTLLDRTAKRQLILLAVKNATNWRVLAAAFPTSAGMRVKL